jgi:hypothetical protein
MQSLRRMLQGCKQHWQIGMICCARWHASWRSTLQHPAQQPALCMLRQGQQPAPQRLQPYPAWPWRQQRHRRQQPHPHRAAKQQTWRRLPHWLLLLLLLLFFCSQPPWCSTTAP